ncbi:MAG: AraC family transcriptional regulator [Beijerinckiaceae bacterium]
MSLTKNALWVIERNQNRDLSLDEIAEACGVSKFHLAHAFGQSVDRSVMQYVRGRRLSEAAKALAAGAPDILDIALQHGYNSHEAFSRAFKSTFGQTPEMIRAERSLDGVVLIEPFQLKDQSAIALKEPKISEHKGILAIGLLGQYAFGANEGIAGQWAKFMGSMFVGIENKVPSIPIGVTLGIDDDGNFDYVTAVEVNSSTTVPSGLTKVQISPRHWAIFEHDGNITTLSKTYMAIWDRWLPDHNQRLANSPSIERHKETFDPRTGNGGVEIWIPIEA